MRLDKLTLVVLTCSGLSGVLDRVQRTPQKLAVHLPPAYGLRGTPVTTLLNWKKAISLTTLQLCEIAAEQLKVFSFYSG